MTDREITEIVKESNLWESLSKEEKQAAIEHALVISRPQQQGKT